MTQVSDLRSELRRLKRKIYQLQEHRRRLVLAGLYQSAEMTDEQLDRLFDEYHTRLLEYEATGARGWWASVGATVRQLRQTLTRISTHEEPTDSRLPDSTRRSRR